MNVEKSVLKNPHSLTLQRANSALPLQEGSDYCHQQPVRSSGPILVLILWACMWPCTAYFLAKSPFHAREKLS